MLKQSQAIVFSQGLIFNAHVPAGGFRVYASLCSSALGACDETGRIHYVRDRKERR